MTGRSLVHRSPIECGMSECDREASVMGRPWPTMRLLHQGRGLKLLKVFESMPKSEIKTIRRFQKNKIIHKTEIASPTKCNT